MALSEQDKAKRKAARQAAAAWERERVADKAAENARLAEEALHAERFNKRSTRTSVAESVSDRALTLEEHRIAEARGLVGPVPAPTHHKPLDSDAATEWLGVPVSSQTDRKALTHGHLADDYIAPDSFVPSAAERERRQHEAALEEWFEADAPDDARPFLRDPFEVPDETLVDLGVNPEFGRWYDDGGEDDEYHLMAEVFVDPFIGDELDDRPEWDRDDLD